MNLYQKINRVCSLLEPVFEDEEPKDIVEAREKLIKAGYKVEKV